MTPTVEPWIENLVSVKQGLAFETLHLSVEMRHAIVPADDDDDDDGDWTKRFKQGCHVDHHKVEHSCR